MPVIPKRSRAWSIDYARPRAPLAASSISMAFPRLCHPLSQGQKESTERLRKLTRAAEACFWAFFILGRRRWRNYAERRRVLVLHAESIARNFILSGEPKTAITVIDHAMRYLPNAALLHAARLCALLICKRADAKDVLLHYAGQQLCRVRWPNLVFLQLHQVQNVPGVARITGELEMLLDRMRPSAAELGRIRLRLPDLANADFAIPTFSTQGADPTVSGNQKSVAGSQPEDAPPFGFTDFELLSVGSPAPVDIIEAKLRRAALVWHRTYGRHWRNAELKKTYELTAPRRVRRLAEIGRRLVQNGNIDAPICELDAALAVFPGAAQLHAVRACTGLLAHRPSGPDILRYYRGQAAAGLTWEQIVFDQLHRLRKAPGMSRQIVSDVEAIFGSAMPPAGELREIRRMIQNAAAVNFPPAIYEEDEDTRVKGWDALGCANAKERGALPAPSVFLLTDYFRLSGRYHFALRRYFLELIRCTSSRKRQSAKKAAEITKIKAYVLFCVSRIVFNLLRHGKFERVLSVVERALATFPNSANLHACRAAALMLLNRHDEAVAIHQRLIAHGADGVRTVAATFDALAAGGWAHPLIGDITGRSSSG